MYVIIFDNRSTIYGPFKDANAAAKWADKNFDVSAKYSWRIALLRKP